MLVVFYFFFFTHETPNSYINVQKRSVIFLRYPCTFKRLRVLSCRAFKTCLWRHVHKQCNKLLQLGHIVYLYRDGVLERPYRFTELRNFFFENLNILIFILLPTIIYVYYYGNIPIVTTVTKWTTNLLSSQCFRVADTWWTFRMFRPLFLYLWYNIKKINYNNN